QLDVGDERARRSHGDVGLAVAIERTARRANDLAVSAERVALEAVGHDGNRPVCIETGDLSGRTASAYRRGGYRRALNSDLEDGRIAASSGLGEVDGVAVRRDEAWIGEASGDDVDLDVRACIGCRPGRRGFLTGEWLDGQGRCRCCCSRRCRELPAIEITDDPRHVCALLPMHMGPTAPAGTRAAGSIRRVRGHNLIPTWRDVLSRKSEKAR